MFFFALLRMVLISDWSNDDMRREKKKRNTEAFAVLDRDY